MTAQQQPPSQPPPVVHVAFARAAYRPGETVIATIDIDNFAPSPSPLSAAAASAGIALPSWAIPQRAPRRDGMSSSSSSAMGGRVGSAPSLTKNASFSGAGGGRASEGEFGTVGGVLIENLVVDLKGVERLDPSWIVLPKSSSGAQSKGERAILEMQHVTPPGSVSVSNHAISNRLLFPNALPHAMHCPCPTPCPACMPPTETRPAGERVILESQLTSLVTNVAIQPGTSKTCTPPLPFPLCLRAQLPRVLPPSYRGTAVRFHYQLTLGGEVGGGGAGKGEVSRGQGGSANTTPLKGRRGAEEGRGGATAGLGKGKGGKGGQGGATSVVEVRVPLRIWTLPNLSGLTVEELDSDDHYGVGGIVPTAPVEVDIQWRERKSRAALMGAYYIKAAMQQFPCLAFSPSDVDNGSSRPDTTRPFFPTPHLSCLLPLPIFPRLAFLPTSRPPSSLSPSPHIPIVASLHAPPPPPEPPAAEEDEEDATAAAAAAESTGAVGGAAGRHTGSPVAATATVTEVGEGEVVSGAGSASLGEGALAAGTSSDTAAGGAVGSDGLQSPHLTRLWSAPLPTEEGSLAGGTQQAGSNEPIGRSKSMTAGKQFSENGGGGGSSESLSSSAAADARGGGGGGAGGAGGGAGGGAWARSSSLLDLEPDSPTLSELGGQAGGGLLFGAYGGAGNGYEGERGGDGGEGRGAPITLCLCHLFHHLLLTSSEVTSESPFGARGPGVRGRTYNIRIDDHVLVRFTPRNPQPVYYLGDVVSEGGWEGLCVRCVVSCTLSFPIEFGPRACLEVSGTLSFPIEDAPRTCLEVCPSLCSIPPARLLSLSPPRPHQVSVLLEMHEVSVLLEMHEVINPRALHTSRRVAAAASAAKTPLHLPVLQMEHHEVTADLLHTHFIFTIPSDAAASFATPIISLQWILRFEFCASTRRPAPPGNTPGSAGKGRQQQQQPPRQQMHERPHALAMGAETERGEWSMPITVHAPLPKVTRE
ncbi:unnamed protein product [Closterium sp. NIES-65]|nr:unnamed protein product [Closterium sp. NIES-65]